ncbi:replication initiation protein RepM [Psychrobacter immobilis]|uniref:replication initiation protein RepM n=1 Tax=Psychrobacter immobilis TaxID=498 RepID=UPI00191A5850|nr:replication initiation protein RepM [Psychrobacter immobilis]
MTKASIVSKANAFIESGYAINLVAQRVIILAIIEAREQGSMSEIGGVHRIKASDYEKHFECDKTTAYRSLKSACESLYESEFVWTDKDAKGRDKINKSRFVQRASYSDGGGYVEVMFGNDVIPLITRLSEKYTEYELKQIKDLNSIYALRIFEILMQWNSVGKTPPITIENLRTRLGIEEHQYKTMGNFKSRVLDHAIKEINDNTNITATYEQHKEGRRIVAFTFKFKIKAKLKKVIDIKRDSDTPDVPTLIKMTSKQRGSFAAQLSRMSELSSYGKQGEDYKEFASRIETELLDESKHAFYIPYLDKLGFKTS